MFGRNFRFFGAITGLLRLSQTEVSMNPAGHIQVASTVPLEYLCRPSRGCRAISSGVERHVDIVEVGGSRPPSPTNSYLSRQFVGETKTQLTNLMNLVPESGRFFEFQVARMFEHLFLELR